MSGGHFNYSQYNLVYLAEEIEELIKSNTDTTKDSYGDTIGRFYEPETIEKFKEAVELLMKAKIYVQRIDYLVSGDDGETTFHNRLMEDLPKPNKKGCYIEEETFGEVYSECVLDIELDILCTYLAEHAIDKKEDCPYWRDNADV